MSELTLDCLQELKIKIKETQAIADLANDILSKPDIGAVSSTLESAPLRRSTANAMTKSALVLLCGYFEGFLKNIIEEFAITLNDNKLPLNSMSDYILLSLVEASIQGDKIKTIKNLQKIKDGIIKSEHIPFDHKQINGTKGNPTVDTVESIFNKIGISDVIDQLSIRDFAVDSTYTRTTQLDKGFLKKINDALNNDTNSSTQIIEIIESKWGPKKQRRAVGYVGVIQELLKTRNRIAHGENFGEQVTPGDLTDYSNHVEKLCEGLHDLIVTELVMYGVPPS